jgi:methylated-DNA-[protein]-cysteine S-methyltransferase
MNAPALLRPVVIAQARADTPLGAVTLAATSRGLAGLWFDGQRHHPGPIAAPVDAGQPWIAQALRQLARYFDGAAAEPFVLPLDPQGSAFQRTVWLALRDIACGQTSSYGALARRLGRDPGAARAVGAAVGRNPLSVIVPCHRVLGGDGSLTGYAGGLERKRALLRLEGAA